MQQSRILVVDDEASIRKALELILVGSEYAVMTARSVAEAITCLRGCPFDLVFTDLCMPDGTGLDLLARAKGEMPEAEVILMTGHGSLDVAIEAIKGGAFYYIEKPFTPDHVLMLADRALQCVSMRRENQLLKNALPGGEDFGIIGHHPKMRQIHDIIRTAAPSDASVLIEGGSGTGKELIATAIHRQSPRAQRPFICVNCAAIPQELLESELFGYRKGAFTGADRDKRGLIEAAGGGTLLLDEITEMPVHLQTKLLRVLQERKLRRLGDEQEISVNFRLVSSTNRDSIQMIRDGVLRDDLYFRISTIKIKVPPLRERLDDLILLAEYFLRRYCEKYNRRIRGISPATLSLLMRYHWPGNARELESVVEHAVLFARENYLKPEDLPEQFHVPLATNFRCVIPPYTTMEEIESEAILQTLERTGGNVKKTAEILHCYRSTLYRKLKKLGLKNVGDPPVAATHAPPEIENPAADSVDLRTEFTYQHRL